MSHQPPDSIAELHEVVTGAGDLADRLLNLAAVELRQDGTALLGDLAWFAAAAGLGNAALIGLDVAFGVLLAPWLGFAGAFVLGAVLDALAAFACWRFAARRLAARRVLRGTRAQLRRSSELLLASLSEPLPAAATRSPDPRFGASPLENS